MEHRRQSGSESIILVRPSASSASRRSAYEIRPDSGCADAQCRHYRYQRRRSFNLGKNRDPLAETGVIVVVLPIENSLLLKFGLVAHAAQQGLPGLSTYYPASYLLCAEALEAPKGGFMVTTESD